MPIISFCSSVASFSFSSQNRKILFFFNSLPRFTSFIVPSPIPSLLSMRNTIMSDLSSLLIYEVTTSLVFAPSSSNIYTSHIPVSKSNNRNDSLTTVYFPPQLELINIVTFSLNLVPCIFSSNPNQK